MNEELASNKLTSAHMTLSNRMKDVFTGTVDHDKSITVNKRGRGVLAEAKGFHAKMSEGQSYDYAFWLDCAARAGREAYLYVFEENAGVEKYIARDIWHLQIVDKFPDWDSALKDMEEFVEAP